MKGKYQKIMGGIALHLVVSSAALGCIRVYQQGYNTTHHEQLQMASLVVGEEQTQLQILGKTCTIPMLSQDSMFYYAAYFLTDAYYKIKSVDKRSVLSYNITR